MSDFSLSSIGVYLSRGKNWELYDEILDVFFLKQRISLLRLELDDLRQLAEISMKQKLEFDDAYQYLLFKRNAWVLISFDRDFDRTDLVRHTPAQVLGAS